jgi:hypothetical protein
MAVCTEWTNSSAKCLPEELSRVSFGCGNSSYDNQTHFPTLRMEKPTGIKKTLKKLRFYNNNLATPKKIISYQKI